MVWVLKMVEEDEERSETAYAVEPFSTRNSLRRRRVSRGRTFWSNETSDETSAGAVKYAYHSE